MQFHHVSKSPFKTLPNFTKVHYWPITTMHNAFPKLLNFTFLISFSLIAGLVVPG
jgi:hypothetical protein